MPRPKSCCVFNHPRGIAAFAPFFPVLQALKFLLRVHSVNSRLKRFCCGLLPVAYGLLLHLRRAEIKTLHLRQLSNDFSMPCGDAEMRAQFFQYASNSFDSALYDNSVPWTALVDLGSRFPVPSELTL